MKSVITTYTANHYIYSQMMYVEKLCRIKIGQLFIYSALAVSNAVVSNFPIWAQDPHAKAVSGDVNGDGRADLALVGGSDWWTVPVAFSNGNGTFRVTNFPIQ